MKFNVYAMSVNPINGDRGGDPRDELIDTETNEMFADCHTPWEVEDRYLAFWNRLNDHWETDFPQGKEKVLVLSVTEVKPCEMFALCENEATTTVPHPVLGEVPTCARCEAKIASLT